MKDGVQFETFQVFCAECGVELKPHSPGGIDHSNGDILCGTCLEDRRLKKATEKAPRADVGTKWAATTPSPIPNDSDWQYLNKYEQASIAEVLVREGYWSDEDSQLLREFLESGSVKKVRNFMSDSPGFWGYIYLIVMPGGPEFSFVVSCYAPDEIHESWRIEATGSEITP